MIATLFVVAVFAATSMSTATPGSYRDQERERNPHRFVASEDHRHPAGRMLAINNEAVFEDQSKSYTLAVGDPAYGRLYSPDGYVVRAGYPAFGTSAHAGPARRSPTLPARRTHPCTPHAPHMHTTASPPPPPGLFLTPLPPFMRTTVQTRGSLRTRSGSCPGRPPHRRRAFNITRPCC